MEEPCLLPAVLARAVPAGLGWAVLAGGLAACQPGAVTSVPEPPQWVAQLVEHAEDAEQVRTVLTSGSDSDDPAVPHLPRVAELVSEWLWLVDDSQQARLGQALMAATGADVDHPPDERSGQLLASLVSALDRAARGRGSAGERWGRTRARPRTGRIGTCGGRRVRLCATG